MELESDAGRGPANSRRNANVALAKQKLLIGKSKIDNHVRQEQPLLSLFDKNRSKNVGNNQCNVY